MSLPSSIRLSVNHSVPNSFVEFLYYSVKNLKYAVINYLLVLNAKCTSFHVIDFAFKHVTAKVNFTYFFELYREQLTTLTALIKPISPIFHRESNYRSFVNTTHLMKIDNCCAQRTSP